MITAQVAILMAKFHSPATFRGPPLTESQRQLCRGVGRGRSVFQNRGADAAHEFGPFGGKKWDRFSLLACSPFFAWEMQSDRSVVTEGDSLVDGRDNLLSL